jgi:hypothetical protein
LATEKVGNANTAAEINKWNFMIQAREGTTLDIEMESGLGCEFIFIFTMLHCLRGLTLQQPEREGGGDCSAFPNF